MKSKFNNLFKQILSEYNGFKPLSKISNTSKIIISNNIISENIISNKIFKNFFDIINNNGDFQHFTKQFFNKIFPPNWKLLKKINKSKKRSQLFIFKIQYTKIEIKNIIIKLLAYLNEELSETDLSTFINAISEHILLSGNNATFISLENITDFSLIFINANNYSMKEIKHEFGHYYQWLTGDNIYLSGNIKNINELEYPKNIHKLFTVGNIQNYINILMNDHEIAPYINELGDYLFEYKLEKFNNLTNKQFIILFFKQYTNFENTSQEYIEKIIKSDLFHWIKNKIPLIIFVLTNIYQCRL